MADNNSEISTATKDLGNKAQKINQASLFANGDLELAKKIVNGEFKDCCIINAKFKSDNTREFGLIMILISKVQLHVKNAFAAMSRSPYVFEEKTNTPWKFFFDKINDLQADPDYDHELSSRVEALLHRSLTTSLITKILQMVEHKNDNQVASAINNAIKTELKLENCLVKSDSHLVSSLEVADAGIGDQNLKADSHSGNLGNSELHEFPTEIHKYIQEAVKAAAVLSPTRGTELSRLHIGDSIKVHIADDTQRGRNLIKILDAETAEGALKAVNAKIRFIKKMKNGNWTIIADIGENIYVRILEETDNVRIATSDLIPGVKKPKKTADSALPLFIGLAIAALIMLMAILIFVFF